MNRALLFAVALVCCPGVADRSAGQVSQPNVLFILADDLGYGDMGVTGQAARKAAGLPYLETPNIDRLANEGVSFTQMYSTPMCKSTRSTLYTGFHQGHSFGDRNSGGQNRIRTGTEDMTYAQVLEPSDYTTGMFGKWHQSDAGGSSVGTPGHRPIEKGFDDMLLLAGQYHTPTMVDDDGMGNVSKITIPEESPGVPRFSQEIVTEHTIDFMQGAVANGDPFVAHINYFLVHRELDLPQRPYPSFNDPSWPIAEQNYARGIHLLDQEVGKLLDYLDDPNGDGDPSDSMTDNTVVIFASDNGNQTKEGHSAEFFDSNSIYRGFKFRSLEGGVRTPFFVRWEGQIAPGTVNDTHVGTYADLLPTFAEMAGQDVPIGLDGKSMWKTLSNTGTSEGTELQAWHSFNDGSWAIRLGDWKLYSKNGLFVYNLAADPSESTDLAASRPDILNALNQLRLDEGLGRDANLSASAGNTYFTQYKRWAPAGGSDDFGDAANWSGGTANGYADGSAPEALNWNTGPADNWLATVNNTTGSALVAEMAVSRKVLAMEVRGDGAGMTVRAQPNTELSARNGVRISAGGRVHLERADLMTNREVDIRPGGTLTGDGVIKGQAALVAGIAEFDGLLEAHVINHGTVAPGQPDDLSPIVSGGPFAPPTEVFKADFDDRVPQVFGSNTAALNNAKDHLNAEAGLVGSWIFTSKPTGTAELIDSSPSGDVGFIIDEQVSNTSDITRWDAVFTQPVPIGADTEVKLDLLWGRTRSGAMEHRLLGMDNAGGGNAVSDRVFMLEWGDEAGVNPDELKLVIGATTIDLGGFFVGGGVLDPAGPWDDSDLLRVEITMDASGMDITVSDDVHSNTVNDIPLTGSLEPLNRLRWTAGSDGIQGYALDDLLVTTGTIEQPPLPVLDELGILTVEGDYTQGAGGALELQLAGTDQADPLNPQHDQLVVTGSAELGGSLAIDQVNEPALGDAFVALSSDTLAGAFDQTQVTGTALTDPATALAVLYEDTADADALVDRVRLLATYKGDANGDGVVSLVDLNALGAGFGQAGTWQNGDFNYDGVVSLADLNDLGSNFGSSITAPGTPGTPGNPGTSSNPGSPAVPEPSVFVMSLFVGLAVLNRRKGTK